MESHEAGFPPFPHSLEIPQGFEPRLIGSEPCPRLFCYSTVNYLELPRECVFTGT
jgi:hypothetical protein